MNEDFECIQVFIKCRDAKGIEPMGYLIKIGCHARNRSDELHFFGLMHALTSAFVMSRRKNSVRVMDASRALPNKV